MRHSATILGSLLLLTACGTKGPLTQLPRPATAPAAAQPASPSVSQPGATAADASTKSEAAR